MINTITVYLNGADKTKDQNTLMNVLHNMTVNPSYEGKSICIEGCNINNKDPRDLGGIFTYHLVSQVNEVVNYIKENIKLNSTLRVNLVGSFEGGAAAFLVGKKLSSLNIDKRQLVINVCALHPVPGKNIYSIAKMDKISGVEYSLTGQIADLSECDFNKVSVLYYSESQQTAILPMMPKNSDLTVDVIPGKEELYNIEKYEEQRSLSADPYSNNGVFPFHYVTRFLENECGIELSYDYYKLEERLKVHQDGILLNLFAKATANVKNARIPMYFDNEIIVYKGSNQLYLNVLHKELSTKQKEKSPDGLCYYVKNPRPKASYTNGLQTNPHIYPMVTIGGGGAAAAVLLYHFPALTTAVAAGAAAKHAYDKCKKPLEKVENTSYKRKI